MKRLQFLKYAGLTGFMTYQYPLAASTLQSDTDPPMNPEVVQEFVRIAHSDLNKVKSMLEERPTLLNVAHDWKNGDFETALGAASHVGNKAVASFLLEQGAQANIFTACLFGKIDIVKPMITAFPSTLQAKGPHGFTLLHHAIKGGDEALEVKEYLESMGATKTIFAIF